MIRTFLCAATITLTPLSAQAERVLQFPMQCELGQTCFLQQLVDMDPGEGFSDSTCGAASYDEHSGTDIRTVRNADLALHGTVVAAADGRVAATRDGMADRLVRTDADRASVDGVGCGNGVLIEHDDGLVTQYCHLAQGSVLVSTGDVVSAGQEIGRVGLSGLTQFPHLEFIVRRDDVVLDPFTGRPEGSGCEGETNPMWIDAGLDEANASTSVLLDAGFADGAVEHSARLRASPERPNRSSGAIVVYAWAINLEADDVLRVTARGPDGFSFEQQSDPLPRRQATYTFFGGRRATPPPGGYEGVAELIRGGDVLDRREFEWTVE